MKLVKINKSYRNGTKEHFLVLLDEPYSNDDINYLVEEWCESKPSGSNYGYTVEWWYGLNLLGKVLMRIREYYESRIN